MTDARQAVTAFIALGTNIGTVDEMRAMLRRAVQRIGEVKGISVEATSSIYKSAAWGVTNQSDFLNAVTKVSTTLHAAELLRRLKSIETELGRIERFKWGPREIDLDLVLYGQETIEQERLRIPHPGLLERAFVVTPLLELAPDVALPDGRLLKDAVAARVREDQSIRVMEPM